MAAPADVATRVRLLAARAHGAGTSRAQRRDVRSGALQGWQQHAAARGLHARPGGGETHQQRQ